MPIDKEEKRDDPGCLDFIEEIIRPLSDDERSLFKKLNKALSHLKTKQVWFNYSNMLSGPGSKIRRIRPIKTLNIALLTVNS